MPRFDDIDIFDGPALDAMGVPITGSNRDMHLQMAESIVRDKYIDPLQAQAEDTLKMKVSEALESVPGITGSAIAKVVSMADSNDPDDKRIFNQLVSKLNLPFDVRRTGDDYRVSKRFQDVLGDNSNVGVSAYLPDEGDNQYRIEASKRFPDFLGGEASVSANMSTEGGPEIRANFVKRFAEGGSAGDIDIFGYNLGGSVGQMMGRRPEVEIPDLSPAQMANIAGGFAPGAGAIEMLGGAPEYPDYDITTGEMISGPRSPSMAEDFDSGEYLSGALKGLGGLGDVLSAVPFVGPVASGILKTPLAVQKILKAGESLEDGLSRTRKSFERGETGAREEYLTLRNARDELGEDFIDEGIGSLTATKGSGDDVSYRMMHSPTTPDAGAARLDDMTGGGNVFPDDVYSSKGLQYYGDPSNKADQESFNIIRAVRADPEAEVTVYRAVPKGVSEINPGDFVTLSPDYAKTHGMSGYGAMGDEAGDVISMKVKVKEVFSDGNDLNEFGFFPMERLQRAKDAGFDTDTVYYHGADADITEFRMPSRETGETKSVGTGVFMSSSPDVAGSYTKTDNSVIYPVYINKSEFIKVRPAKSGEPWSSISKEGLLVEFPDGTVKPASEVFDFGPKSKVKGEKLQEYLNQTTTTDDLARRARKAGYKGLIIENVVDASVGSAGLYRNEAKYLKEQGYDVNPALTNQSDEARDAYRDIPVDIRREARSSAKEALYQPSDIVVSLDPSNIRSVNAEFDPKQKKSANILKANGGAVDLDDIDVFEDSTGDIERLLSRMPTDMGPLQMAIPEEESLRSQLQRLISDAMGGDRQAYRRAKKILDVLDFIPVAGDATAAIDTVDYAKAGMPVEAGIASIGLIPGVGGILAKGAGKLKDGIVSLKSSIEDQISLPLGEQKRLQVGYYHPAGGGLKLKTLPKDMDYELSPSGVLVPSKTIKPEDMEGGRIIFDAGDRAVAGQKLVRINGIDLEFPIDLLGGPEFMMYQKHLRDNGGIGSIWAGDKSAITRLGRQSVGDEETYFMPTVMTQTALDFNTMMSDALIQQVPKMKITKKTKKEFDKAVKKIRPEWKGIDHPEAREQLLGVKGGPLRLAFLDRMEKAEFQSKGFPDVVQTRVAITDPDYLDLPFASGGMTIGRVDKSNPILNKKGEVVGFEPVQNPNLSHATYNTQLSGDYMGGFEVPIPRQILAPDFYAARRAAGIKPGGDARSFQLSKPTQEATPEWVDTVSEYIEQVKANQ